MRFDILTIFPEVFDSVLKISVIGKAVEAGLIEINAVDIRQFSENKHRKVDDYPYGGGSGMVMMAQPIYSAYMSIVKGLTKKPKVIYMTPQGIPLTQAHATMYSGYGHVIVLCGHYEGIDERLLDEIVDEEISIGDYVLTGGELPAMVFIDAVSRAIPGVLSSEESYLVETHANGLLEYPQFTRPVDFNGRRVPEVLLSGHHLKIAEWRMKESLLCTRKKRPDMYKKYELADKEKQ